MTETEKAAAVLDALSPGPDTCPRCGRPSVLVTFGYDAVVQAVCTHCAKWLFWNREQAIRRWREGWPKDLEPLWAVINVGT